MLKRLAVIMLSVALIAASMVGCTTPQSVEDVSQSPKVYAIG
jgi:predicted small secreted protein